MQPKRISVWVDLGVVAAIFLAATLLGAFCVAAGMTIAGGSLGEQLTFAAYSVQMLLAIAGAAVYYRYRRGGERVLPRISFKWQSAPLTLLGVVLITASSVVLEPLLNLFPDHYFDRLNEAIGSGFWAIMLSVVAAPVLEEIFFRGLVLEQTLRRWAPWQAVGITALLFGVVHLPILPQAVNAVVMGVIMGYIYVRTRSLASVIVIHAINNAIAYLIMETTGSQNTDTRDIIGNDTIYWLIYGASAVVLILSVVLMARGAGNKNKNIEENKDEQTVS
jgi:membrane protease YdiL (CAAX protease family)